MKLTINDNNPIVLGVNDNNNIPLRIDGELVNIGTSDYNDLENKPTIEGTTLQGDLTLEDLKAYTRAQIDALLAYKANLSDLATVATTGDYDDLINAPELATVATSGDYTDLANKPVNVSAFINDAGYLTEELEPMFNGSDAANITAENIASWNNKAEGVQDLGYIDSEEYEDDRDVFFNTLLNDGVYRFIWGDGDDFEYYVVVESMLDDGNGFVYQKYWYSEEGSRYLYNCSLTLEDGEVVDRYEDNYITMNDANGMFATKSHGHYESKSDNMSVFDWCDTNGLTFDNTKPLIIYTDTLNNKNWIIERYTTLRSPNYRFIRVYDMSDASHFYIRSGSYVGNTITWGNWEEYTTGGGSSATTAFTVTLLSSDWNNNEQTVNNALFVAAGYAYVVAPGGANYENYTNAQIYADDVTTNGVMKFHCKTAPTNNITVNIVRVTE